MNDGRIIGGILNSRYSQRIWAALAAIAVAVALQPSAIAATDAAAGGQEEELDPVIVKGNSLGGIRKAISDTEERFYARFNELNSDNDFDIHCSESAPLGTRLRNRRCLPAFYMDALTEEANRLIADAVGVQGLLSDNSQVGDYAQVIWLERSDEYRQKALAVINNDRQLRALIRQREALDKKFNERRKEVFKGRWISW